MTEEDYELKRAYFRLSHLSKAGVLFVALLFCGLALILFLGKIHILQELGIALVPVALVALAYELFLRQEFLGEMKVELSSSLAGHFEQFDRLRRAGVHDIADSFQTTEIARRMNSAESIRIIQTWIPDIITLLKAIVHALKHGGRARILLLNPDSQLASYRAKSLKYVDGTMATSNIRANLAEISRAAQIGGVVDCLEVRLFDALPIACVHAYDNEAVVGFFWEGIPAISGPQFVISRADSQLMATVNEHFENLWAESTPFIIKTPDSVAR